MMKTLLVLTMVLAAILPAAEKQPRLSSFTPGELWPDNNGVHINAHGGGICMWKGVYYWFGEHKIEGTKGNNAHVGVHVYASKDLYNWHDMGIALKVDESDPKSPIAKGCILERPKVVYCRKTKKFVMWFHLELKGRGYSAAQSGVAVASKITGPYKFLRSGRVNPGKWPMNLPEDQRTTEGSVMPHLKGSFYEEGDDKLAFLRRDFEKGQMARDMTIFVDDDGKAYHIYSSEGNSTLHIAELSDDYTEHTGRYVRLFEGRFMEAPAICKRNGKYYLVMSGCTGWWPNAARSAVASHIFGPWMELKNPCVGKKAGSTFGGQSTYILPIAGKKGQFIFMADIWRPDNAIDGRYLWLPMKWEGDQIRIENHEEWKY